MERNRRLEDKLSLTEIMNSNKPKELIAKVYIELIKMNGRVRFHDKFIWGFIGVLVTGVVGGGIALLVNCLL